MPDMQTPEADAVEQEQLVVDAGPDPEATAGTAHEDAPFEVDEGDLAESTREVPMDDEDWR